LPAGVFALVVGWLIGSCSPFEPITLDCRQLGQPPSPDPPVRVEMERFSVISPAGNWCFAGRTPSDVSFGSHPWLGKRIEQEPDPDFLGNTFILSAMAVALRPADGTTAGDLRPLVEAWSRAGFGVSDEGVERFVDLQPLPRFAIQSVEVASDPDRPDNCVRYRYVAHETDNPRAPGKTLILREAGSVCRLPTSAWRMVVVGLSERAVLGKQIDEGLFERILNETWRPLFDSLRLKEA
jgi:hypothetical protein